VSGNSQEQERLRRLRERQLADRDPHVKQRQFQRVSSQREKRLRKQSYSINKMWKDIPQTWKGFFYGLLLGVVALLVIPIFWQSSWSFAVSLVILVVLILFGIVIGRAIDARENIKDLMR